MIFCFFNSCYGHQQGQSMFLRDFCNVIILWFVLGFCAFSFGGFAQVQQLTLSGHFVQSGLCNQPCSCPSGCICNSTGTCFCPLNNVSGNIFIFP